MNLLRCILSAAFVIAPVSACTSEGDEPQTVVANEQYVTDNGYFSLKFAAANGQTFNDELLGPTDLAIDLEVGPDPGPDGPIVNGKPFTPEPPLKLTLGQARPWDGPGGPQTISSNPTPVTPDGFQWITKLSAGPGVWVQPVTISDAAGNEDTCEVAFRFVAK